LIETEKGLSMQNILIGTFHRLLGLTFLLLALNIQPALARVFRGDSAKNPSINFTTDLARYYAPYALQAAAAYMDVSRLDATRAVAGSDVQAAVDYVYSGKLLADDDKKAWTDKATKYLRPWQYQFGSDAYLQCLEADPDCLKIMIKEDRWRRAIDGGPAFHVWARTGPPERQGTACSEVSIAFRGTDPTRPTIGADLISDGDPLSRVGFDTYYSQLRRNIDTILRRITTLRCYRGKDATQIVSVGHSLGGGLAHLAALANNPKGHRITKVFAFDTTPVTGSYYVKKDVLAENVRTLEIDRIHQSKEMLEVFRKRYYKPYPRSEAACVRNVPFAVFDSDSSKESHSMLDLGYGLVQLSYLDGKQRGYVRPKPLSNCPTEYHTPITDPDELAPDGTVMSSRDAPATRVTSADRGRAMNSYAMTGGFGLASPQPTEINGAVAPKSGKRAGKAQAPLVQAAFDAGWPPG
jgi:pimeloyl-ACP methyl ester carboxylesterase